MSGKFIGVGVGPGDPELMTLKAVRIIAENEIIAVPVGDGKAESAKNSAAYRIAQGAVPGLDKKDILCLEMPMTKDRLKMAQQHEKAAARIAEELDRGRNVVFLTLGDPTIYSTFSYLQKHLQKSGYITETVNGVPSFCAAAAAAGTALAEWDEPLHIYPAAHKENAFEDGENYVLMKAGKQLSKIKETLRETDRNLLYAENLGMPGERLLTGLEEIPDEAGYFTLLIVGSSSRQVKNIQEKENRL